MRCTSGEVGGGGAQRNSPQGRHSTPVERMDAAGEAMEAPSSSSSSLQLLHDGGEAAAATAASAVKGKPGRKFKVPEGLTSELFASKFKAERHGNVASYTCECGARIVGREKVLAHAQSEPHKDDAYWVDELRKAAERAEAEAEAATPRRASTMVRNVRARTASKRAKRLRMYESDDDDSSNSDSSSEEEEEDYEEEEEEEEEEEPKRATKPVKTATRRASKPAVPSDVDERIRELEARWEARLEAAEARARAAEHRAEKAEARAQAAEDRAQAAEGRSQLAEGRAQVAEGRARAAEDRAQAAEDRAWRRQRRRANEAPDAQDPVQPVQLQPPHGPRQAAVAGPAAAAQPRATSSSPVGSDFPWA